MAEAYPDLKANQNMMAIQEELSATENKIAFARQAYNDSVMEYNTQREVFPTSVIAGMFNFQEANLFENRRAARSGSPQGLLHLSAAMDFFDRQDHARRQTRRLVVMFVLAVAVIIVAIYLVMALAVGAGGADDGHAGDRRGGRRPTPGIRSPTPGIRRPAAGMRSTASGNRSSSSGSAWARSW